MRGITTPSHSQRDGNGQVGGDGSMDKRVKKMCFILKI